MPSRGVCFQNLLQLKYIFVLILYLGYGSIFYRPWQQIIDIADDNPLSLLENLHPHAWRLIVAYPGLLLNQLVDSDIGFGIYTGLIGFFCYFLWIKLTILLTNKPPKFTQFLFLILCMSMNGRGIFAWFSWLLCIFICMHFQKNFRVFFVPITMLGIVISKLFSTVSSGVFFVVFCSFVLFFLRELLFLKSSKVIQKSISLAGIFFLWSLGETYLLVSTQKNMGYYNITQINFSAILTLAEHGLGYLVNFYWFQLLIPISVLLSINGIFWLWTKRRKMRANIWIFIGSSLMGGIFGLTTLTLVLPILLSLCTLISFTISRRSRYE